MRGSRNTHKLITAQAFPFLQLSTAQTVTIWEERCQKMQCLQVEASVETSRSRRENRDEEGETLVNCRDSSKFGPQAKTILCELFALDDFGELAGDVKAVRGDAHVVDCCSGES